MCATLASLQATLAFEASPLFAPQKQVGCRSHGALSLRMQDEPVVARRSLLGMAGASVLLSGQEALAKDAPKAKPVFVEKGLSYIVKKEPDGGPLAKLALAVSPGDFVVINYIAYLRDGTIFDNTVKRKKPLAFQIGKKQQIEGLEKGIMGMKPGEQRQLFIKSELAYGEDGVCLEQDGEEQEDDDAGCLVPPDTDLVYDVTLVNTGPAPNN